MYSKVVSIGCSFSNEMEEYSGVKLTYGDFIAKHYNVEHINLAENGFSNYGIYRKSIQWCLDNIENRKDALFIVGLTSHLRFEMWTNRYGLLTKFNWGHLTEHPHLKELGWKKKEIEKFQFDFFDTVGDHRQYQSKLLIIGLSSFFKSMNIDYLMFPALYAPSVKNIGTFQECNIHYYNEQFESFIIDNKLACDKDNWHPNQKAHKLWSKKLLQCLNQ